MSERADALLAYVAKDGNVTQARGMRVARAICEHLGLDWDDVAMLRALAERFDTKADNFERTGPLAVWAERKADAIATLLEAAGIER